jgi:hypothetical protein
MVRHGFLERFTGAWKRGRLELTDLQDAADGFEQ